MRERQIHLVTCRGEGTTCSLDLFSSDDSCIPNSTTPREGRRMRGGRREGEEGGGIMDLPGRRLRGGEHHERGGFGVTLKAIDNTTTAVVVNVVVIKRMELARLGRRIVATGRALTGTRDICARARVGLRSGLSASSVRGCTRSGLNVAGTAGARGRFIALTNKSGTRISTDRRDSGLFARF